MPTNAPRAVFVSRETDYEFLLARHSTREQARFFLETRGQRIEEVERRGEQVAATRPAARAPPPGSRRGSSSRRVGGGSGGWSGAASSSPPPCTPRVPPFPTRGD